MAWQVQQAKQRLSEVLHLAEQEGAQTVTRRGREIAVIVGIEDYRKLTGPVADLRDHLLAFPKLDDDIRDEVFAEIQAQRSSVLDRDIALPVGWDRA